MPNELIEDNGPSSWPRDQAASSFMSLHAEPAIGSEESGAEQGTCIAPPFRSPLDSSVSAISMEPSVLPESQQVSAADLPSIPGYEIIAELGRGGMGVIYRAWQCSLNRPVALKMILTGLQADTAACLRFQTEAEAVARLRHINIVQIHEVGQHKGRPFLSLEYVEGGSLMQRVARTAQSETESARLVETLARAVQYMHQRGILHRDLKPSNVLLTAEGTPKITDFGLAKFLDRDTGLTRNETMFGTPSYMAPEQAAGDLTKVGASADVYALGAILYELLTGRAPFEGTTPLVTLEQVRTQDPVRPRRLRSSISQDLETICLKCLEKQPAKRYASAGALADDLHRFLDGQHIQARPARMWQRRCKFRSGLVARVFSAVALLCVTLVCAWYFHIAGRLKRQWSEERYRQFVELRDEALFYGLVAADQGPPFLCAELSASLDTAESAALKALGHAGVIPYSEAPAVDSRLPASRKNEVTADCYTLLLVLAGIRGQPATADRSGTERYREAIQLLEAGRKLGFQTSAYHLRRAQFLERLNELDESKRELNRSRAIPPDGALDHFLVGEEQYRRGDLDLAASSFNRALAVEPGHFWAQFFLAVCHLKEQRWDAARADLNGCLSRRPDFLWAYLFRSFANEKLGALAEAEADYRSTIELHPSEDARYILFLTRGIFRFDRGQLDQAADDFRCAITLKPEQYNAYLNLAHVFLALGQFDEAEEQMRATLRFRPPTAAVVGYYAERGRHFLQGEQYQQAIQACQVALNKSPDQPLPHEILGNALLALERYELAEESFDEYFRTGGAGVPEVFCARGLARMKLGKFPGAVEDYAHALERAPVASIYQHRGWAYFFCDAWKLALNDFSKTIELSADMNDAYVGRGLALVMLGDYRAAVADAEVAWRGRPDTPEMMHNIACIFAQSIDRTDRQQEAASGQLLADHYRNRAVEAIRQTLAMLPPPDRSSFWQEKISRDAALVPIRDDANFRLLKQQYAQQ